MNKISLGTRPFISCIGITFSNRTPRKYGYGIRLYSKKTEHLDFLARKNLTRTYSTTQNKQSVENKYKRFFPTEDAWWRGIFLGFFVIIIYKLEKIENDTKFIKYETRGLDAKFRGIDKELEKINKNT